MKILVALFLVAVIGVIMAEDVAKDAEKVASKNVAGRKVHISPEQRARLGERRKEYLKAHPNIQGNPELVRDNRKIMHDRKVEMMKIKKSDLPLEEKKAKIASLKKGFHEEKIALGFQGVRGMLSPEQRRAMVEKKMVSRKDEMKSNKQRGMPKVAMKQHAKANGREGGN